MAIDIAKTNVCVKRKWQNVTLQAKLLTKIILDVLKHFWNKLLVNCEDVNHTCEIFYQKLNMFLKSCIPTKKVTFRPNDKPWFDSNLRRECRKRDQFRRKAKQTMLLLDITKFKKQRPISNH